MKKTKLCLKILLITFVIGITFYYSLYIIATLLPSLPIKKNNSYYLYDINNDLYTTNKNDWIKLDDISQYLIDATIASEDKSFYKHQGFDYLRIIKAMYTNIINNQKLEGASTITQQYAKNLFLTFDKTWQRKIEEAWLSIRIETHYTKDEILEGYLNTINYGGVFGIENAAQYYFGKSAKDLNLSEATILAGIPKSPAYYSPLASEESAKKRQSSILNAMVKNHYITEEEADIAFNVALIYESNSNSANLSTLMYYQDSVIDELKSIKSIPKSLLETGSLKIYTNLDLKAQDALEKSMKMNIKNNNIECAAIAINPTTGQILGLIGGKDYSISQYNRAIYSKRAVGSTIKPFLYYAALENGFTSTTTFKSEKTSFTFGDYQVYSPTNYGDTYPNKPITLAAAIAFSDNIYAVKTHLFLGEQTLVDITNRLGIKGMQAVPSLALGSNEISLYDMVSAYSIFANNGSKSEPYFIRKVEDEFGNTLYEYNEPTIDVLNSSLVFILNEILTGTYDQELIDYQYPTCQVISYKIKHKYAIKTGTTATDHLIFGYNKDFLIGIWSGYDDNKLVVSNDGYAIKNMWIDSMELYLQNKENSWYQIPKNVVGVLMEPVSGNIATSSSKHKKIMYYIKGTEPAYE